jgi:hypothetical protein
MPYILYSVRVNIDKSQVDYYLSGEYKVSWRVFIILGL